MMSEQDYSSFKFIDYDDIAEVAIDMANYVDKIKPDVVITPLASGWTTGKIVFEALRNNVGVSVHDYDPPVFPMVLNHYCDRGKVFWISNFQLKKLRKLKRTKFSDFYPKFENVMIIDHTNLCESPKIYLSENEKNIKRLGNRIYINLMAGLDEQVQKMCLSNAGLLQDKKFEFHFSRIKREKIPFDDQPDLTGLTNIKIPQYNDGLPTFDYVPHGFNSERVYHEGHFKALKEKQIYKHIKEALDRMKQ